MLRLPGGTSPSGLYEDVAGKSKQSGDWQPYSQGSG